MVDSFRDLIVWQKAMNQAVLLYALVKKLPREELYALSDQMRRAAVSVPSNIAEGHSRNSKKEYIQFLSIAKGSNAELQTHCLLCEKLGYLSEAELQPVLSQSVEIAKMLNSLITKLTPTPQPLTDERSNAT